MCNEREDLRTRGFSNPTSTQVVDVGLYTGEVVITFTTPTGQKIDVPQGSKITLTIK